MMRLVVWFLFLISSVFAVHPTNPQATALPQNRRAPWSRNVLENETKVAIRSGRFDRLINKIFDNADSNLDGSINFGECYELVLKLYVNINRQAPIPPPSRRVFYRLFAKADVDHDTKISRGEFRALARTLGHRALARVAAHKIMTMLVAPLLAEYVVRKLTGLNWLPEVARFLVPDRFEEKVLPIITSHQFCRTVLMILFMATLGNIFIGAVNMYLDMSLPPEDQSYEQTFYK